MKKWLCLLAFLCLPAFAAPKVVVSIKPLHDIALAIMDSAGTPTLLVPPGASPHHYALSPSQAAALYQANVIVWVGPSLETFLTAPLEQRSDSTKVLSVLDTPGMTLYPMRGNRGGDDHEHDHGDTDPHLWLDPRNLIAYASQLATTLSALDPENAELYASNLEVLTEELTELDQNVQKTLAPVKSVPLMVFHDAYQYFEKHYGLNIVGVVLPRPDRVPSASSVFDIKQRLKSQNVQCIFSEPQFLPAIVERLVVDTNIRHGVLDPLGDPTPIGLDGTKALFNNLAKNIVACAKPSK